MPDDSDQPRTVMSGRDGQTIAEKLGMKKAYPSYLTQPLRPSNSELIQEHKPPPFPVERLAASIRRLCQGPPVTVLSVRELSYAEVERVTKTPEDFLELLVFSVKTMISPDAIAISNALGFQQSKASTLTLRREALIQQGEASSYRTLIRREEAGALDLARQMAVLKQLRDEGYLTLKPQPRSDGA